MFFAKKKDDLTVQCSKCEWNPDGGKHWACSCGHLWNTFKTKGKCPKCNTEWEMTSCPACNNSEPHQNWYKTKEEIRIIESTGNQKLREKKKSLEKRLIDYGIRNKRVSHLPYLDHSDVKFQSTYDAGCRMMILYSMGYLVNNLDDRPQTIDWLKNENIWDEVSPLEKAFLNNPEPAEELLAELSWNIEAAITLGWCLNKVGILSKLDDDRNTSDFEEFVQNVPALGDSLMLFLTQLQYRDMGEIYEENLLNEMITTYFRDLMFNRSKDETKIDRLKSFERHRVLNWLRTYTCEKYSTKGEEWDETDTST